MRREVEEEKNISKGWRRRTYKWQSGVPRTGSDATYAPRRGSAPLLFRTETRYQILSALAHGTMRIARLREHACIRNVDETPAALIRSGLIIRWGDLPWRWVALDPEHPCAGELRRLLLVLAELHKVRPPHYHPDNCIGGEPRRRLGPRDLSALFGGPTRTWPLLLVFVEGRATSSGIARLLPRTHIQEVRRGLHMMRAFRVLNIQRIGVQAWFSLRQDYPAYKQISEVLSALDRAAPIYRALANGGSGKLPRRERTRLKSGGW